MKNERNGRLFISYGDQTHQEEEEEEEEGPSGTSLLAMDQRHKHNFSKLRKGGKEACSEVQGASLCQHG